MPNGTGGRGAGRGQGGGPGGRCRRAGNSQEVGGGVGAADSCICPACGAKAPHERGIPCFQVNCPQCGKPMVRG